MTTAVDTTSLESIRDEFTEFYERLYHVTDSVLRVCVDTETVSHPCSTTGSK